MTDDLRRRIAAALWDGYTYDPCENPDAWAARMADAVIAELGLTYDCRYCGGWGPEHG